MVDKTATNLIGLQKPLLREFFPEIDECQTGTINLQLDHALDVRIPDIVTPPIAWQSGSNAGERFAFTKVELEFLKRRYQASIYVAEFSIHSFNYNLVEVVARPIEGISPGRECVLKAGLLRPAGQLKDNVSGEAKATPTGVRSTPDSRSDNTLSVVILGADPSVRRYAIASGWRGQLPGWVYPPLGERTPAC